MGGLYSLTLECVQGLKREHWGTKIQVPSKFELEFDDEGKPTGVKIVDYESHDTDVQPAIDELINRLGSNAPIKMGSSLTLIAPKNESALTIINVDGDEVNIGGDSFTGDVTNITGFSISIDGCTVTVTPETQTLSFVGGVLKAVS